MCELDLQITDRQGVEIDYCPKCRGVWLDRGELDKIIERSAADLKPPQPPTGQGYQNTGYYDKHSDSHHGDHHYGKRRKSFLEQLFD